MPHKGKSATATGVIVPASIQELVKVGSFGYINPAFLPENSSRWINPGDRVRGELSLIRMDHRYSALEAVAAASAAHLQLATVYELAYFATHGWDGHEFVIAFGSSYTPEKSCHSGAFLWSGDIKRGLSLWVVDSQNPCWFDYHTLLCVQA